MIEHVGGETFAGSIRAVRTGGRIVTCGATAGFHPAIDLRHIFFRQVEVLGSTMGSKADLLAVLGHVAAGPAQADRARGVAARACRRCAIASSRSARAFGKVVLDSADACTGLGKDYGERAAVKALDLDVVRGEILGLLGPNGAGKTTTISMACGVVTPSRGTVAISGIDLAKDPCAAKAKLGLVPQDLALFEELSAIQNLRYFGAALGPATPDRHPAVGHVDRDVVPSHARQVQLDHEGGLGLLELGTHHQAVRPVGVPDVLDHLPQAGAPGKTSSSGAGAFTATVLPLALLAVLVVMVVMVVLLPCRQDWAWLTSSAPGPASAL